MDNKFFRFNFKDKFNKIFKVNADRDDILEELEELLILSDITYDLSIKLVEAIRRKSSLKSGKKELVKILKEEIKLIFNSIENPSFTVNKGDVILLIGINGSGKTTSAAKLAYHYKRKGLDVILSAADTFRAAGSSQLKLWGDKLNIPVVGGDLGADPGSVIFNSLSSMISKEADLLIIDTAGRVQTRDNLMKELERVVKIIKKFKEDQPNKIWLVIDANQGKNTFDQAVKFKEVAGLTGLILSKFDGTSKGGTILSIVDEMKVPVAFIGIGEKEGDIIPFNLDYYLNQLVGE